MSIEGRLKITLGIDAGYVTEVTIDSSRPVHAASVLSNRSAAAALKLLSMLFAICGMAQAKAGVQACEQALGVRAGAGTDELRQCLVRAETVREHLSRIFLSWPDMIGLSPEPEAMAELLALERAYRLALNRDGDLFTVARVVHRPGQEMLLPAVSKLEEILERKLFGMPSSRWLAIDDPDSFRKWAVAGATPLAHLLVWVMDSVGSDVGRCEILPLPELDQEQLSTAMEQPAFIERPRWGGECRETSSLSRTDSPLLRELARRHGNGLLVRLIARLTEVAQLAEKLLPGESETAEVQSSADSPGLGEVEAARGHLIHRVALDGDRIVDYRILAPTEWNFHPDGVVARSLATLSGDAPQIQRQAKLLIEAIDPCVAYELTFI